MELCTDMDGLPRKLQTQFQMFQIYKNKNKYKYAGSMTILGMNNLNLISRETGKLFYEIFSCPLKGKSGDCTANLSPQRRDCAN